MQIGTHKRPKIDRDAIQKKVVRRVLTILFIAVISVSLFAPQNERVAVSGGSNVAASNTAGAKSFTMKVDWGTATFSGNNITHSLFGKVGTYTCRGGTCTGYVPFKASRISSKFDTPEMNIVTKCTSAKCSATKNGKPEELKPDQIAALRKFTGVKEVPQKAVGSASQQKIESCLNGKGEGCVNRCSTTYIKVTTAGTPEVVDCYGSFEDKAKVAVQALAQCVAKNTQGVSNPGDIIRKYNQVFPEFEKGLCTAQWENNVSDKQKATLQKERNSSTSSIKTNPKAAGTPGENGEYFAIASTLPLVVYPIKTPPVPAACQTEYSTVLAIIGAYNTGGITVPTATRATAQDALSCAWKGAVNCYAKNPLQPDVLTCEKKIETSLKDVVSPVGSCTGPTKRLCEYRKTIERQLNDLQNSLANRYNGSQGFFGQGFGQGFSPYGQQQNNNQVRCGANQTRSVESGRVVCKDKTKPAAKPQCIIAASKEEIKAGEQVTIKWKTAGAEKVSITDIGSSVPKSEEKIVRPTETTTYKLTATGKGKNNTKTCEVKVVVDGEIDGAIGASPPKLSCSPSTVRKDRSSEVKWACPSSADSSEGFGIDTKGRISGDVTVSPGYNTQYSVACLDKDKKVIGKNSCSVSVGEPTYDMLVYPTSAKRGDRVRVSWASLFMKNCRVTGPRGFDYNKTQGVVLTEPFSEIVVGVPSRNLTAAVYTIECESVFGSTVSRDVTVRFEK